MSVRSVVAVVTLLLVGCTEPTRLEGADPTRHTPSDITAGSDGSQDTLPATNTWDPPPKLDDPREQSGRHSTRSPGGEGISITEQVRITVLDVDGDVVIGAEP